MTENKLEYLDVEDTSLDEWLSLLRNPPAKKVFAATFFPSLRHRREFYGRLHELDNQTVMSVLRSFLVCTGSTTPDMHDAKVVSCLIEEGELSLDQMSEHRRRLIMHLQSEGEYPVWEGVQWVLDLTASSTLDRLDWRELEWLVGALYEDMGYSVEVTPRSNDGGIDVLATGEDRAAPTRIAVQVKRWARTKGVGEGAIRELLGAMKLRGVTSGVMITTGRFTTGARELVDRDARLDAIDRGELIKLLNEHCGTDWHLRVDYLISWMQANHPTSS